MSLPIKTGLPETLTLTSGYTVRFTATDPTTGALVTGVKVSQVSIFGDTVTPEAIEEFGPFMLVPGPNPVEA